MKNSQLIVHQAYRIGPTLWRIAFLCSTRGLVEIFREIPRVPCEFEQAALVRAAITQFRNS